MARSVRAEAMVEAVERSVRPRMKGKDAVALEVSDECTVMFLPPLTFHSVNSQHIYFPNLLPLFFCRSYHRNNNMKNCAVNEDINQKNITVENRTSLIFTLIDRLALVISSIKIKIKTLHTLYWQLPLYRNESHNTPFLFFMESCSAFLPSFSRASRTEERRTTWFSTLRTVETQRWQVLHELMWTTVVMTCGGYSRGDPRSSFIGIDNNTWLFGLIIIGYWSMQFCQLINHNTLPV